MQIINRKSAIFDAFSINGEAYKRSQSYKRAKRNKLLTLSL